MNKINILLSEVENKTNKNYDVIQLLGRVGARSSVYLLTDEEQNKYALKISSNNNVDWYKKNISSYNLIKNLNYNGNLKLPSLISYNENYFLEVYKGECLENKLYNSLNENEQNNIIDYLASFLVFLHNQDIEIEKKDYQLIDHDFLIHLDFIKKSLSLNEYDYYKDLYEVYLNRDISDEINVLTHGDIRSQNLLYDLDKKDVTLIDFELASISNIYRDFIPSAAASYGFSFNFLIKLITKYNKLSNKSINIKKIKMLFELGIIDEYARVAYYNKTKMSKKVLEIMKNMLSDLNEVFNKYNF